jgi:hypothetical protein
MRSLGAPLTDHFDLRQLFGLTATDDLFGAACARAHYKPLASGPPPGTFVGSRYHQPPQANGAGFASRNGVPLSANCRNNADGVQRSPYC